MVGREDRQATVRLHTLQQIGHLNVGVTVVTIPHFATFTEKGVGLVKE